MCVYVCMLSNVCVCSLYAELCVCVCLYAKQCASMCVKYTHTTRLLTDLHWLPVIARIKFKTLVLAYQAIKGSAPAYIQQLIRPYTPTRPLRSATSGLLAPPAHYTCTARSRLLSVLATRWWNDLPVDVRTAETLSTFKRRLKTHLF